MYFRPFPVFDLSRFSHNSHIGGQKLRSSPRKPFSTLTRIPLSDPINHLQIQLYSSYKQLELQKATVINMDRLPKQLEALSNEDGVTSNLAKWISATNLSDIPADTLLIAKYLILDGIAAIIACAQLPWSQAAARAVFDMEPEGSCSIQGWHDKKLSPLAATLLNSTFLMGFEIDDFHPNSLIHSNAVILPALFAASESVLRSSRNSKAVTGADFLRAYIVGCEVGLKLGDALGGSQLMSQGWLNGGVQGPSAAAAAVSSLLRLDPGEIESALGLACTQSGGLVSVTKGSMAKRMAHGLAARSGVFAALMAREDFTGPSDVYERPYGGFLQTFTHGSSSIPKYLPQKLVSDLGSRWDIHDVKIRHHACAPALQSLVDCIKNLQVLHEPRFRDENLENIVSIETEHSKSVYEFGTSVAVSNDDVNGTVTPNVSQRVASAQMSIQYIGAAQLVHREIFIKAFGDRCFHDRRLWKMMAKIKPTHCPEFDQQSNPHWRTRVRVRFTDGSMVEEYLQAPKGRLSVGSGDEIVAKWRRLSQNVLDEARREKIEKCVLSLENVDDISQLTDLMSGQVHSQLDIGNKMC